MLSGREITCRICARIAKSGIYVMAVAVKQRTFITEVLMRRIRYLLKNSCKITDDLSCYFVAPTYENPTGNPPIRRGMSVGFLRLWIYAHKPFLFVGTDA